MPTRDGRGEKIKHLTVVRAEPAPDRAYPMTSLARLLVRAFQVRNAKARGTESAPNPRLVRPTVGIVRLGFCGEEAGSSRGGTGKQLRGQPCIVRCFWGHVRVRCFSALTSFVDVFVQSPVLPVYPALSVASCHPRAASRTGTLQNTMGLPGPGPGHCQVLSSLCLGSWQWRPLCRLFQRMQPDGYLSLRT